MKLHIYIFRQLLLAFLFSAAGMVFIAMPGVAVGAVHKLGGAGMASVLRLVPLMVAVFVPYVLPVALLLALVSTYGRLAAQNEWTAMRMSGMNPYRMLMPAMLLALLAGGGVYALNAEVLPRIKVANKTIQLDELKQVLKNLSRGRTELSIDEFYLSSAYRDPDDHQTFYDCLIVIPARGDEEPQSFMAEAVRFNFTDTDMIVHLYNARGTQRGVEVERIEESAIVISLDKITGADRVHDFSNPRYLTSDQLQESMQRMDWERRILPYSLIAVGLHPRARMLELWDAPRARLSYTWHQHLANAATCLMFVLVGVSSGLLLRKGTQLTALAVAVSYAMMYWIASLRLGKQLAREGVLEPWVGAWAPLLFFSIIGLWLTRKAFRE